jgi:PilZ domain
MMSALARAHRAHERRLVSWNARLRQDARILDCKAVDVSNGGVRIRINEPLVINSWVVLTIDPVGSFPGEVRWQDERFAGIRFLHDAAVVEGRLQQISQVEEG